MWFYLDTDSSKYPGSITESLSGKCLSQAHTWISPALASLCGVCLPLTCMYLISPSGSGQTRQESSEQFKEYEECSCCLGNQWKICCQNRYCALSLWRPCTNSQLTTLYLLWFLHDSSTDFTSSPGYDIYQREKVNLAHSYSHNTMSHCLCHIAVSYRLKFTNH